MVQLMDKEYSQVLLENSYHGMDYSICRFSAWVIGKDKIYDTEQIYGTASPSYSLIFMADVIHGCRTIYPIPLERAPFIGTGV